MNKNKPTVTIGIPAYNEEANIGYLLADLLKQKQTGFKLDKILVYSDGSTDNTVSIIQSFRNPLIEVIDNPERLGVAAGLNAICKAVRSDVLVILGADMGVDDNELICKLILPIIRGKADLTSGWLQAIPPKTWFEKIIFHGRIYQNQVFYEYQKGNNLHTCFGAVRALSGRLYQHLRFPTSVGEDMYSYLFCIRNGYNYQSVKSAVVSYKLPDNFADHKQQSVRYFRSKDRMAKEFGESFVNQEMKIPFFAYLTGGFWAVTHFPIYAVAYVAITLTTKIMALFDLQAATNDKWERALSTTVLKS